MIATVITCALSPYYVDTVRLAGTGCTGNRLTVKVTLNTGTTHPEITYPLAVAGTNINTGVLPNFGPLDVAVGFKLVKASDLQSIAVLVTGS